MKVTISLNDVLRDQINQLIYTYDKYFFYGKEKKSQIEYSGITEYDLTKYFTEFNSLQELNTFMYLEHPLEVNGHADETYDGLSNKLNEFMMDISDDHDVSFELVSKEIDKSIPATFFYLSKTGCRFKTIRFVTDSKEEWGDSDILITANPIALENKPNGKISIKIATPYNKDIEADYTYDSLIELINNKEKIEILIKK